MTETKLAPTTSLEIVVAASENGVIGRDGDLPWHLPDDLRHFKRLTVGHPGILGRRTFESIVEARGAPLPKRRSIVLSGDASTRRRLEERWGVETAADLDAALALALEPAPPEKICVLGGSRVYAAALPRADVLHLTRVHAAVEGDARFPEPDLSRWRLVESREHPADERHEHAFTFERWQRLPERDA